MPQTISQSAASTQFIQVQVRAMIAGTAYDPTADTVAMAFIPEPATATPPLNPQPSDWHPAEWQTDPGPSYWAACLVGPANGGVSLTQGIYQTWVMVTDDPAVPVLQGPLLNIT